MAATDSSLSAGRRITKLAFAAFLSTLPTAAMAGSVDGRNFDFGTSGTVAGARYDAKRGFGYEGMAPPRGRHGVEGSPFLFSVDLPEGNYRVTVVLGGDKASETTVKAELRRLMLERVAAPAGGSVRRSFVVNVRTPFFPGGQVRLKVPREVTREARAWDARLTLEFDGRPAVRSIRIEPVTVPTVFLLGDSTVADQPGEPYASWGQMLPRFMTANVAVANHASSGESTFSAVAARRFDRIEAELKAGDVVMIQFGHNDQKNPAPDRDVQYRRTLMDWATRVRARGATPIIVTPVLRNRFEGTRPVDSLAPFPERAREAAATSGAFLIDLHALSGRLYATLGPRATLALFKHDADGGRRDGTHHSPYGAYELARIVACRLATIDARLAGMVLPEARRCDPSHPAPESAFLVPPSLAQGAQRPVGD